MIDEADHECGVTPDVPEQRRPHAEAWLGRTVVDSAAAPRIARSDGGALPDEVDGNDETPADD